MLGTKTQDVNRVVYVYCRIDYVVYFSCSTHFAEGKGGIEKQNLVIAKLPSCEIYPSRRKGLIDS